MKKVIKNVPHLYSSRHWMAQHNHIRIAAHGLHRVGQGLALLRRGSGFAEVHDRAAEPLHRCSKRAAGPSAHLVEHGCHDLTLAINKSINK